MLPSTRTILFCLWILIRVLNCLKNRNSRIHCKLVCCPKDLHVHVMFFALLLVIVVILFWTEPDKHTFMHSSCGFPHSINSTIECAPPSLSRWQTTYNVNKWTFINKKNINKKIDEVKDKSYIRNKTRIKGITKKLTWCFVTTLVPSMNARSETWVLPLRCDKTASLFRAQHLHQIYVT